MKLVHARTAETQGASAHRPGGVRFLSLLQGDENTPGNFHLMVVEAQDYQAPRHRHNFDQVRIVLEGEFGFGPGMKQDACMLGYFTEGTYYTQNGEGRSTTLLLQSGGASGEGYMSDRQLRRAVQELQAKGSFEDGVFTHVDTAGKKHNQDGYEAAWEHVRGRPIRYPRPRYEQPVIWRADRFAWQATDQPGVQVRRFGEFTEKALRVAQVRVASGANCQLSSGGQDLLFSLSSGEAHAAGETLEKFSSGHLKPGETIALHADTDMELHVFGLMQHEPATH